VADKVNEYQVSHTVTLQLTRKVKAASIIDALEVAKGIKLPTLLKETPGTDIQDSSVRLFGISSGAWMNGQ
jgi:hypothetical protein